MGRWREFRRCQGCSYDFATGEGQRACNLYDCAYLPGELNVWCDWCRFNFFTMEGNPPCEDPLNCPHGEEPRSHVGNVATWLEVSGIGDPAGGSTRPRGSVSPGQT